MLLQNSSSRLNDVEFREVHEFAKVDKIKIVACDGKSEHP